MFIARMGVGGRSRAVARRVLDARRLLPEGEARRAIAVYSLGSFIGGGVAFLIGGYVIALLKHASAFTLPVVGQVMRGRSRS